MELGYRGHTYQQQETKIEFTTSNETARFLGQKYICHYPLAIARPQLDRRKYRGIIYGN